MALTFYKNAEIASENSATLKKAHVLVEDGMIKSVGPDVPEPKGEEGEVIDCSGKIMLPAMFDVHVHLREPGREDKETIQTGSEAAINGGVTGILAMPNTTPAIDSGNLVRSVLDAAARKCRIPVMTSGCITKSMAGEELASIASMKEAGAVMITDDGKPVSNPQILRRAMEYAADFGLLVASHCETMELSGKGAMNEGKVSYRLGIPGIPACSEEICLDRDIRLAHCTNTSVHIQHVTTGFGMETIRRYKELGIGVTCEVSPHHLIFNEDHIVDYDTRYKMNPPLRTPEDNAMLLQGLIDGVFDVIATDHAPHTDFEKAQDFASAPFGITGLETAVVSLYHHFIKTGKFGWDLLVKRYSNEPRRLVGLDIVEIVEGNNAELIVFNPGASTTFTADFMKSKSNNTPFFDNTLDGSVEHVRLGDTVLK